jgi:predicted dehydrogenase
MLRVAIVGCGKIADSHAEQISRIDGCEVIAVCDREQLMARQFADRFGVANRFEDVTTLLENSRPHVVHITTPPQSHYDLARQCLQAGCHVYVEKPFTLVAAQAEELINLAIDSNLKLTAGHDAQFSHAARRMRHEIARGYLGGSPVHMESYYGYDFSDGYAVAVLGDQHHWVRALPGKLLQNIISHGIARIAEFLSGNDAEVSAYGFRSRALQQRGEAEIVDELRAIITDNTGTTAYFTFSSQMRPTLHQFRIFGPKNALLLDQDNETLIKLRGDRYRSYLEQFLPPLTLAEQYVRNSFRNVWSFMRNDFHAKSGMKYLIDAFYRSIVNGAPPPISHREILLTSRIMDEIFSQIATNESFTAPTSRRVPSRCDHNAATFPSYR